MSVVYDEEGVTIHHGDCRDVLSSLYAGSVQTCVTSPPYFGLRDYGADGQIGLEPTPDEYVAALVDVFRGVRRVLADDGTLWLNLGDSYATPGTRHGNRGGGFEEGRVDEHRRFYVSAVDGCKTKDLIGVPWSVAFALRADGWYLRSDIIWHKPNPMPESVTDRPTKAHEYLFLLSKRPNYFYDADAIAEDQTTKSGARYYGTRGDHEYNLASGFRAQPHRDKSGSYGDGETRNKRSVWTVTPTSYPGAHFATFPPDLIRPCILAGSAPGDAVLDPFGGSGTTAEVARELGRRAVSIDCNRDYCGLQVDRFRQRVLFPPVASQSPLEPVPKCAS